MAASSDNPWWMDVLEHGPHSPYATFFDIDWNPSGSPLQQKVLLPLLGKPYGEVLADQELTLRLEEDGIYVHYYDTRLPININGCASVISHRCDALAADIGACHPAFLRLSQVIRAIEELAPDGTRDRLRSIKEELLQIVHTSPQVKNHVCQNIDAFNGNKGFSRSFDFLDDLLSKQFYQLAFWRPAIEQLNYRRFFDISELTGVRVEDAHVFTSLHALIMHLVKERQVSGLRLDHIDGLYDPLAYLDRLQSRIGSVLTNHSDDNRFYVVAEKILAGNETLRQDWPVAGTTGYDFLNALNALYVNGNGNAALRASYARFVGIETSFRQIVAEKKRQVIAELFTSEVQSLSHRLALLALHDRHGRDISRDELTVALIEITASLPVYRTYVRGLPVSQADRTVVEGAVAAASSNPQLAEQALRFVQRVLLLDFPDDMETERQNAWLNFVMRWQQFTGPVMAKGVEDTALYNYSCLISLNDVGGEPGREDFGMENFHNFNQARLSRWPHSMNATSTHDTKRSEDVRARINVLSEIPREWERRVLCWRRCNQHKKIAGSGSPTMIGAWPLREDETSTFTARLKAYVIKAAREAKACTNWLSPNEENESALLSFVDAIMQPSSQNRFLEDFLSLQKRVAFYGALNALSQVLLKATAPGTPDFYQGTELWDFSLVDPDNRRPVDFERRKELLDNLIVHEASDVSFLLSELLDAWEDGRIKLYLTHKVLSARNSFTDVFSQGAYIPLQATSAAAKHVCAFARRHQDIWVLSVAPRLMTQRCEVGRFPLGGQAWQDDVLILPAGAPPLWLNILTNERVAAGSVHGGLRLADVFSQFPAALFVTCD
jgi:(1->4)-alpha-D-glucan 1-alpha-D-glucosylmutase